MAIRGAPDVNQKPPAVQQPRTCCVRTCTGLKVIVGVALVGSVVLGVLAFLVKGGYLNTWAVTKNTFVASAMVGGPIVAVIIGIIIYRRCTRAPIAPAPVNNNPTQSGSKTEPINPKPKNTDVPLPQPPPTQPKLLININDDKEPLRFNPNSSLAPNGQDTPDGGTAGGGGAVGDGSRRGPDLQNKEPSTNSESGNSDMFA